MVHQTHHLINQHICAPLRTEQCIVKQERWKNYWYWGAEELSWWDDFSWGDGNPKTTIPKEIVLLSKMWQDDEPLIYPRHRVFFFFFFNSTKKRNRLIYCKNHTKQATEDIQTFTRTQPKTLTALTHTTFHTNHTQLSNQTKNVHMVIWSK